MHMQKGHMLSSRQKIQIHEKVIDHQLWNFTPTTNQSPVVFTVGEAGDFRRNVKEQRGGVKAS